MCDQNQILSLRDRCPHCSTCEENANLSDMPLNIIRYEGSERIFCIIMDKRCARYYNPSTGRHEETPNGLRGKLPESNNNSNNNNNNNGKNNNNNNNNNNKPNNNNNNNNNKNNNKGNQNPKQINPTKTPNNNTNNTKNNVNAATKTLPNNTIPNTIVDNAIATDSTNVTTSATVTEVSPSSLIDANSNNNNSIQANLNNDNIIDGANQIGDKKVNYGPYVIGSLSIFSILLVVVGFLYYKKRNNDHDSDTDPIFRSSSVFFATPIVDKRSSQGTNVSNRSGNSAHNRTIISSKDDGDYDIVISPTNINNKSVVPNNNINNNPGNNNPGNNENFSISAYQPIFSDAITNAPYENPSDTQNNWMTTTTTTTNYASNSIFSQTAPDNSENIIQPLTPTTTTNNQFATNQNTSFNYDIHDVSTHEPSNSFINSTNGISFINNNNNNKDESCILSPIMENKTASNIFTADMIDNTNDIKTSTPNLSSPNVKKTLSMVISEYKEDTVYIAKYNYDPSMEDEMKIRINDRVLIIEKFNDGWAYGENKTSESFGIFPINRLDPTS